nr:MAG TPA: hypothetical protein [Caudoviricetes sp.]
MRSSCLAAWSRSMAAHRAASNSSRAFWKSSSTARLLCECRGFSTAQKSFQQRKNQREDFLVRLTPDARHVSLITSRASAFLFFSFLFFYYKQRLTIG